MEERLRTIDENFGAGDVVRHIGREEKHELSHLFGGAGLSPGKRDFTGGEFYGSAHTGETAASGVVPDLSRDGAGADRVNADLLGCEFQGAHACEGHLASL